MGDLFAADDPNDIEFTINKDYAENYSKWRSKEFLQHQKDVAHKGSHSSCDESSSEDDEDAKDLEHYEKGFFQTMAWLKTEDPNKYDDNRDFFPGPSTLPKKSTDKGKKSLFLRDYERNFLLGKQGRFSDDEEVLEQDPRAYSPTYVEEQKALRESFKQALENSDAEEEQKDIGNLFKKKEKTEAELQKEEEDYVEWLKGHKKQIKDENTARELKKLRDYWTDPKLSSDEIFLRDYILNHKFLDTEDKDYQPAYNELVHDSCDLDADMKNVDQMDDFERKYNFRFEEPDKEFIKRYPRSSETSFRRKDDRRRKKRLEIKERRKAEKEAKMEEIKQLKAIKRKEILAKIEKIKEVTGNDINLQGDDFEDDFDPEKHDQKMSELFSDDYYQVKEEEKPEYPELERDLEIENWEDWQGKDAEDEQHNGYTGDNVLDQAECETADFNMDCDYDPKAQLQDELVNMTKRQRKQRKKSKFAAAIAKEKPVFDPNDKRFEEYFDEYYKLDCEDIVGDIPCRFKYRRTTPNSYGLTIDEILRADVSELNQWCSIKKMVKYKPEKVEKYDVQAYKKKASNEALKRKILPSLYSRNESEDAVDTSKENQNSNDTSKENQNSNDTSKENQNSNDTPKENQNSVGSSESFVKKKKCRRSFVKKRLNAAKNYAQQENQNSNDTSKENRNSVGSSESFVKKKKRGRSSVKKGLNEARNDTKMQNQNSKDTSKENQNSVGSSESFVEKKKCRRSFVKKRLNGPKNDTSNENQNFVVSKAKSDNEAKQRKRKLTKSDSDFPISDDRLKAYGIHPKRFKNKLKYGNIQNK